MAAVSFKSPAPFQGGDVSRRSLFSTNLDKSTGINEPIQMDKEDPLNSYRSVELSDLRQSYENQKSKLKQFDENFRETHSRALNFQIKEPHGYPEQPKIVVNTSDLIQTDKPKQRESHYGYPYKIMGDVFCSTAESGRGSARTSQVDETPRLGRRSGARNHGFNTEFLTHNTLNSNNNSSNIEQVEKSGPNSILKLPANIRHGFGSRTCDELLSDTVKVHETLEKQNQSRRPMFRNISNIGQPTGLKTPLTDYEDIGRHTRVNLFPGSSVRKEISVTKHDFNESVFLQREPESDKYKMKRDDLSTWAESNVIRDRLKKAWDQSHTVEKKS